MKSMCSIPASTACRQRAWSSLFKGCFHNGLGILAASLLLSLCIDLHARPVPRIADYCPPEPATGQLNYKSVDSANTACTPGPRDVVGQAIFQCWQQFVIDIKGCQVSMRTTTDQVVGPGRMPCRMFTLSGNLTGEGVEAQLWAEVDGPGLLSYYRNEPEAVAALQFDSSRQLVHDIWGFMRTFTGDPRFDDQSWIDQEIFRHQQSDQMTDDHIAADSLAINQVALLKPKPLSEMEMQELEMVEMQEMEMEGNQDQKEKEGDQLVSEHHRSIRRRQQLETATQEDHQGLETEMKVELDEKGLTGLMLKQYKRGPMRVYRTSETRVVVKVPTGCKYRYTVNPNSHVFESPAQHHAHVQWHTVLITAASLSVVLSVVGLGTCTYLSRKHAEYVASYWEYQAVKDQLGSELPPSMYIRLFGAQPKITAAAATTAAATSQGGGGGGGGAVAATAATAVAERAPPVLLPFRH